MIILKRIDFIDVFKAIGVFFVIFGHMPVEREMYSYIFSFQLAIFYFVGGFLYRDSHVSNSFWDYLMKKVKHILIPYFVLCLISSIIYIFYNSYQSNSYDVLDILKTVLISKRNKIYINVPLWFLTSFFTVEIIYYILKCFFNNFLIGVIVFIFGFIGVIIFRTTGSLNTLFWSFDASLYFIIYYFIGDSVYRILSYVNGDFLNFFKKLFLIFLVSIIINVMNLFNLIEHADIIYYDFGFLISLISYMFHVFISLTGVFTYLFLSYILKWIGILKFIGRNSLYYFSFHIPLYNILYNEGIFDLIFGIENLDFTSINLVGIKYTIFLILVITPFVLCIDFVKKVISKLL